MPPDDPRLAGAGGYCDQYGDLHINAEQDSIAQAQLAVVHEFFHHGQRFTTSTASGNWQLMNTYPTSSWLIEGSARWFEDEVYDSFNSYAGGDSYPRILNVGLAAPEPAVLGDFSLPENPYQRFAFLKWLHSKCGSLSFMYLLNPKREYDESGLENMAAFVRDWSCNFGDGFGNANSGSFASGLLGFTAATVWLQDASVLEADENPNGFTFAGGTPTITPDATCTDEEKCPETAKKAFTMPPASSRTLIVSQASLAPEAKATLNVTADNPAWVSIWSAEEIPEENAANIGLPGLGSEVNATWFRTDEKESYEYGGDSPDKSAGLFVTLVNPDPLTSATVKVRAALPQSGLIIVPDMANEIWPPIYVWGTPEEEYLLEARYSADLPESYRITWTFGDETPDAVVNDANTVEHTWNNVGQFPVTATLTEQPSGAVLAEGASTANIGYFRGNCKLNQFSGGTSGEFGDPYVRDYYVAVIQAMAADPANTYFSLSRWEDGGLSAYLTHDPQGGEAEGRLIASYEPDDDIDRGDCPTIFNLNGNRVTTQFGPSIATLDNGEKRATLCISFDGTQNGTELQGTFSFWAKYYKYGEAPPETEGSASYTLKGNFVKKR